MSDSKRIKTKVTAYKGMLNNTHLMRQPFGPEWSFQFCPSPVITQKFQIQKLQVNQFAGVINVC